MNIHMIMERPTDRLNWQYQLNQFKGKVDLSLSPTIPSIEKLEPETLCAEDVVLILLNDLNGLSAIKEAQRGFIKEINLLAVVSRDCELNYGRQGVEEHIQAVNCDFGAVYYETQGSSEVFFQCLFKPKRKSARSDIFLGGEEETILIDLEEPEVQAPKKSKGIRGTEPRLKRRFARFDLFEGSKKKPRTWLKKQPRLRLCVHGESALAYELGAVLSSISEQSVLIMDLDRLSPTADIYCGIKPVVKEKYDFYSKAAATGLNILLDCMKKSALSRDVFRLCSQQTKGYANLHLLTGVYKLEDYEYYKAEDLKKLVDSASAYYDVVILKTNSFPYDGFTLNSFLMADVILWGGSTAIESIRYNRQLIQLMESKQKIPVEKQLWTLFEKPVMEGLEKNFLVAMGLGTYCGSIPFSERREKCLRVGERYLDKHRRELESAYEPILKIIYKGGW